MGGRLWRTARCTVFLQLVASFFSVPLVPITFHAGSKNYEKNNNFTIISLYDLADFGGGFDESISG
jgi:hypothetical protein